MHYGSRSVLSVCPMLAATFLIYELNFWCYKVPYGVPNVWFVWISPKTLFFFFFLASFTDSKLEVLDFFRLAIA